MILIVIPILPRLFTVVSIPDAEHKLIVRNGWPGTGWTWPEAYWDALDDWLDEVTRRRD